jgi:hypothetical protein
MGERKVLCKYYPPDFNPDRLIKNKRPKDKQDNVRMMLPMSLRCNTCGNYLYIGTKFNMRKETCLNEDYMNIKIFRFYMKCTRCYAEITMKTDPKNSDYIVEHGGTRNYEPWRDAQAAEATLKEIRQEEEEGNAMKFLEHKTYDSKKEMDILDALEDIKQMNKRKSQVTHEQLLQSAYGKYDEHDKRDNEYLDNDEMVAELFKVNRIKRLDDDGEENSEDKSVASEDSTKAPSINVESALKTKNGGNSTASKHFDKPLVQEKKDLGIRLLVKPVKKMKVSDGKDPNLLEKTMNAAANIVVKTSNLTPPLLNSQKPKALVSLCDYDDD